MKTEKLKKFEMIYEDIMQGNDPNDIGIKFVNLTPHDVVLNDGTVYKPQAVSARVDSRHGEFDENHIANVVFGKITGLPAPTPGVIYIVSALVASRAAEQGRTTADLVSPATGHPDCVRDKGRIVSVPGFIRAQ